MLAIKVLERTGNQSSVTSLLLLSVRLNVLTDVLYAKPPNTPKRRRNWGINDSPSPYSFIVTFNVVIDLFLHSPLATMTGQLIKLVLSAATVTVSVSVVIDEFNDRPR